MEVDIDTIVNQELQAENQRKEAEKAQKKEDTKRTGKIKVKLNKMSVKKVAQPFSMDHVRTKNVPQEWQVVARDILYDAMSLPAGAQKDELKSRLKKSKDMNMFVDEIPLFKMGAYTLPYPVLMGLTWATHYTNVKYEHGGSLFDIFKRAPKPVEKPVEEQPIAGFQVVAREE